MSNNLTILFVGGGLETLPGVRLAKSMGCYVVVSDINADAPCMVEADATLIASTYDVDESVAVARQYHRDVRPINGVMCMATDVPLTVATIAEDLGLPGIPVLSAQVVADKVAMKDRFLSSGIPLPWYTEVFDADSLKQIVKMRGYPLVLKPVDSRGARGVLRLMPGIDLDWAFSASKSYSPTKRVMVEEFLDGPQISTESLVVQGEVYTLGFSDRNYEFLDRYAPNIIENGGDLPSFLSLADQEKICDLLEKTAKSLDITNGILKGDIVLSGGKPFVIEVALRLSGGYFCSHEIPLNTGIDFVENAIRLALGQSIDPNELIPEFNRPVCQRYFFPTPGKVEEVYVPEWIRNDPEIALFEIRVRPGDIIDRPVHHPSRAGVVIATGKDRDDARNRAECAIKDTRINTVLN
ncbi:MAG: ATP-grasp domain-containing protein [Comamonadaceae bacterium]|nr:MAG: ATP-grasp domain-containing protein [Comamonadaceae bacterium]